MYITKVAPLKKIPLPSPQLLTYFTSQKLENGSLVFIPLRNKEVSAIVFSQEKVSEAKAEIKNADFEIRPISKVTGRRIMPDYQIRLAEWLSEYYWASLGKTLSLFLPSHFLKKIIKENSNCSKGVLAKSEIDDFFILYFR